MFTCSPALDAILHRLRHTFCIIRISGQQLLSSLGCVSRWYKLNPLRCSIPATADSRRVACLKEPWIVALLAAEALLLVSVVVFRRHQSFTFAVFMMIGARTIVYRKGISVGLDWTLLILLLELISSIFPLVSHPWQPLTPPLSHEALSGVLSAVFSRITTDIGSVYPMGGVGGLNSRMQTTYQLFDIRCLSLEPYRDKLPLNSDCASAPMREATVIRIWRVLEWEAQVFAS